MASELAVKGLPYGENERTNSALRQATPLDASAAADRAEGAPQPTPTSRPAAAAPASDDPLLTLPPTDLAPTPIDVAEQVVMSSTNPMLRLAAARLTQDRM